LLSTAHVEAQAPHSPTAARKAPRKRKKRRPPPEPVAVEPQPEPVAPAPAPPPGPAPTVSPPSTPPPASPAAPEPAPSPPPPANPQLQPTPQPIDTSRDKPPPPPPEHPLPEQLQPVAPKPPTLILELDPEWGFRSFVDTEPSSTDKRFSTPGNFALGGRAELYPLASTNAGVFRDIGFTGVYARALPFTSKDFDKNDEIDTEWYRYGGALKVRVRPGGNPLTLGFIAGWERWVFDFSSTNPATMPSLEPIREIPRARYDLLVGGMDIRHSLGTVALLFDVAYLHTLSIAPLGDRTPAPGYGLRGGLGLALVLTRAIEFDFRAHYAIVRFPLRSVPGRYDEAGRVSDQYVLVNVGVAFTF